MHTHILTYIRSGELAELGGGELQHGYLGDEIKTALVGGGGGGDGVVDGGGGDDDDEGEA